MKHLSFQKKCVSLLTEYIKINRKEKYSNGKQKNTEKRNPTDL